MGWGRKLTLGVAALALGAGGFVLAARSGMLKPDEAQMRARYGYPQSQYITVGDQALHLVDEGQGPVVVLVHGSFASVHMWDGWAEALKGHYRVIRFDRPGMGLSGPNPQGLYTGAAEADLIARLADQLKLDRFTIVGTSSGGEGVAHYAATHPERLTGVILSNIAAGPIVMRPPHYGPWFRAVLATDPWFKGWHTQALWRGVLTSNFADPAKVSDDLVREWTELNNRAQGWPRQFKVGGAPPFAGTPADLAAIRAPALVLWSDKDPEVPLEKDGQATLRTLGSADKALVVMANCGHMMPEECSAPSATAAKAFLDRITAAAPGTAGGGR
ncbi:alpha/beta fold hydrolase [Novosphingobium sp. FSY-8]|uniref:Alpha/beta fold hydrolase n=1 Tax=Novosphingobium ovatum TaxID=1908523 RepID=A0ABW9XBQ6_9SPHN|nr:alpha/beta hydrolase [Novosphingobium ovatum]NBC35965.1 alpha/beta fold hydrolase [Novosphingobium ovatum]